MYKKFSNLFFFSNFWVLRRELRFFFPPEITARKSTIFFFIFSSRFSILVKFFQGDRKIDFSRSNRSDRIFSRWISQQMKKTVINRSRSVGNKCGRLKRRSSFYEAWSRTKKSWDTCSLKWKNTVTPIICEIQWKKGWKKKYTHWE